MFIQKHLSRLSFRVIKIFAFALFFFAIHHTLINISNNSTSIFKENIVRLLSGKSYRNLTNCILKRGLGKKGVAEAFCLLKWSKNGFNSDVLREGTIQVKISILSLLSIFSIFISYSTKIVFWFNKDSVGTHLYLLLET